MSTIPPIAVPILEAMRLSGIGRTTLYRLLKLRRIKALKQGRRTLVVVQSLRDYLATLPDYQPETGPNR